MSNFTFDFDLDDDLDDQFDFAVKSTAGPTKKATEVEEEYEPFAEVPIAELLSSLPESISYSPLVIHLTSPSPKTTQNETTPSVVLARRDLFDARLQLIASSTEEQENEGGRVSGLDFIEAPSDLVPGVYEGGLKTWECSMDLVDYLHDSIHGGGEAGQGSVGTVRGKRILEIGCGTAVPSLYLMQELFTTIVSENGSDSNHPAVDTHFHLQDYNRSVLELVTLPNIILAWYMSPLSASYRSTLPPPTQNSEEDSEEPQIDHPNPSSSTPGELTFTPSLLTAFTSSLSQHNIHLRFFVGSWDGFDVSSVWRSAPLKSDDEGKGPYYDIVLTSETIYRSESLQALLRVLRSASSVSTEKTLEDRAAELSLDTSTSSAGSKRDVKGEDGDGQGICLVAAKVLYFGVGGGVQDFVRAVENGQGVQDESDGKGKGRVETVWERKEGVGRKIMRARWR